MLVVLICEFQKYFEIKRMSEGALFAHIGYVYAQLYIMKINLQRILESDKEDVSKELIRNNSEILRQEIDIIRSIDYMRFSKKNVFALRHKEFCDWLITDLSSFVSEGTYLAIAVNTDQIEIIKATGLRGFVTSSSHYTNATIRKLIKRAESMISVIDKYGQFIDNACKKRFVWELKKLSVEKATDIELADIEDYIKED